MPALAICYTMKIFSFSLFNNLVEFYMGLMSNDTSDRQVDMKFLFISSKLNQINLSLGRFRQRASRNQLSFEARVFMASTTDHSRV